MTKPKNLPGLTMDELTAKTGMNRRTIYDWVRAGLLPRSASSGLGVRYDDAFAERTATIRRLRREGLSFDQIRQHLAPPPQQPEPPVPPVDSGMTGSSAPAPLTPHQPESPVPPAHPVGLPSEHWERLILLPGLELLYRTDGGPVLRRLAAEIWKQFGVSPAARAETPQPPAVGGDARNARIASQGTSPGPATE